MGLRVVLIARLVLVFWLSALGCTQELASALEASDFEDALGYTIVAVTAVRGEFEGASFDRPVALENGMIFEFSTISFAFAYAPTAIVLAMKVTPEQLRQGGIGKIPDRPLIFYKLIIEDEIYEVIRLR